jgi:hypothetical protein
MDDLQRTVDQKTKALLDRISEDNGRHGGLLDRQTTHGSALSSSGGMRSQKTVCADTHVPRSQPARARPPSRSSGCGAIGWISPSGAATRRSRTEQRP